MNKHTKQHVQLKTKLGLRAETVRRLTQLELGQVVGGDSFPSKNPPCSLNCGPTG